MFFKRPSLRLLTLLAVLIALMTAAFVAAQDDDENDPTELLDARGVAVRPLEDVTESGPQIQDITDDSARLNFVGTIPLACVVVFGTTPDFGSASIDQKMGGATIIEHNPLMTDLEPDTEYYYRVQGSAEDGTFYVGEVGTFRTAPASEEPVANLLSPERGAEIVGVSSNFGGQPNDGNFGALNAFDGNSGTAWSSAGDGDDAWIEVRLAQRSRIDRVEFWTRSMSDGSSIVQEFTITTGEGETYGPFELPDFEQAYEFEVDITAETLRFDVVSSTGGNTGALEIAVYGEPVEDG
jgi:hypothetical protein